MITYFVRGGNFIKIGQSRNLKGRIASLQISNPHRLTVIKTTVQVTEREAHVWAERLTERKASEWFEETPEFLAWIESLEHAEPKPREAKIKYESASNNQSPQSAVTHHVDLAKVLTAEELAKFKAAAQAAGAASLTEHFLNITLRVPHPKAA